MKKFVFTIDEATCNANGKDANASELLAVMSKYGTVEDYEMVTAQAKNEYQRIIDNVTVQYNAIKEQKLTVDEVDMLRAYRNGKTASNKVYIDENNALRNELNNVKATNQKVVDNIKALLGN